MLGIENIAAYIPEKRISNFSRKERFGMSNDFIENKLGVGSVAVKESTENTSDLCLKAYTNLQNKIDIDKNDIDTIIVVTQNPDYQLPQTASILHGELGVKNKCASFDISLGCSGYIYGLSVITSFMQSNNYKKGLLFTADPYSKILDPYDKNTAMLFGDAATVSLISADPVYTSLDYSFGTIGSSYKHLLCENNTLYMHGRGISNFVAKVIPDDINNLLNKNRLKTLDIDRYLFHQGSKYIIDSLTKRLNVSESKVALDMYEYGNTVSSSIPILLEQEIPISKNKLFVASGFGVGLSWANMIIKRVKN